MDAVAVTEVLEANLHDRERHLREVEESLIAMHPHAEVDLGDRAQAVRLGNREQQAELDAVPGEEGHAFEHAPAARVLAGEWLHQAGELRKEQVEHWPRGQLGDAAAALRLKIRAEFQRTQ